MKQPSVHYLKLLQPQYQHYLIAETLHFTKNMQFKSMTRAVADAFLQIKQVYQLKRSKRRSSNLVITQAAAMLIGYAIFGFYFFVVPTLIRQVWPTIIHTFTPGQIYFQSLNLVNFIILWVLCFGFMALQKMNIPWLESIKNTQKKWPWVQNNQKWQKLLIKTMLVMFINGFTISSIIMWVTLLKPLPYDFSIQNWPSTLTMIWQIILFMLIQDLLFYTTHKMLHHPRLYWMHKQHHEYNQTVSIAVQYSDPLDFIISGLVPMSTGFIVLSRLTHVHFITIFIWIFYRSLQTCIGHCGYDLCFDPGSLLPFAIGADHHDFHHAQNCGNYGSLFMFWDALFGTQKDYIEWLKKDVENKNKIKDQKLKSA